MRTTTRAIATVVAIATLATGAGAQQATAGSPTRFEIRPFVGAFVPTGDNRDLIEDAVLVGLSGAYHLAPSIALVGTFGWAPSELKGLPFDNDLDLFQYDLGVQAHRAYVLASGWTVTPLAGLGVGARTYNVRDLDADETDLAGYGALGAEVSRGRFGLQVTARDYVTAFDGIDTSENDSRARNDLAFGTGITIRF